MSREDACAATVRLQTLAIGALAFVAMLERISRSVSSGVAASMRTRFLSNAATDRMSHAHKMRGRRDRNQTFPREVVAVPVGVHAIAGEFVPFLAGAWIDRTTKRSSSLDVERKEANNAVVEGAVSTRQNRMELARWRRVFQINQGFGSPVRPEIPDRWLRRAWRRVSRQSLGANAAAP